LGIIVCLEGPSAAGKTTLAARLGASHGAAIIPELDASAAPPVESSTAWFIDRHAGRWQRALELSASSPFAVIDGDPWKGLWYNWMHASQGWQNIDAVLPVYRAHVDRGTIGFPDLYVYLDATEVQVRLRRAHDLTRPRRNHEMHIRTMDAQRRYFAALQQEAAGHVVMLETSDRATLPSMVEAALTKRSASRLNASAILEHMASWVRTNTP
jgi:deoxyadenosine/deoxycytidine kinase